MTRIADVERAHQAARRTVATVINDQASVHLAAKLLGHIDPKVTIEHYIRRNEHANPLTAELLDGDEAGLIASRASGRNRLLRANTSHPAAPALT